MNTLIKACLMAATLTLPGAVYAQTDAAPKADTPPKAAATGMTMNCPMMSDMTGMQKDMGTMMSEMQAMMKDMKDPATKERMEKMHAQMSVMMANMQKMGKSGMMGGGMMGGKQSGSAAPAEPKAAPAKSGKAPATPEDHSAHHPAQ